MAELLASREEVGRLSTLLEASQAEVEAARAETQRI
jgi:hypothetical protein